MTTETGKGRDVRYTIEGCDNSHDWRHPIGGRPVLVNGVERTVEKVCRACLVLESSPLAEQPCYRSRTRAVIAEAARQMAAKLDAKADAALDDEVSRGIMQSADWVRQWGGLPPDED